MIKKQLSLIIHIKPVVKNNPLLKRLLTWEKERLWLPMICAQIGRLYPKCNTLQLYNCCEQLRLNVLNLQSQWPEHSELEYYCNLFDTPHQSLSKSQQAMLHRIHTARKSDPRAAQHKMVLYFWCTITAHFFLLTTYVQWKCLHILQDNNNNTRSVRQQLLEMDEQYFGLFQTKRPTAIITSNKPPKSRGITFDPELIDKDEDEVLTNTF